MNFFFVIYAYELFTSGVILVFLSTGSPVQFSCSIMSDSLWPHGLQHTCPPCPLPTPGVYSNSCPLRQWCHQTISSSAVPISSHPQSFPATGSFQMNKLFASGGLISFTINRLDLLAVQGLSRVFSNTIVQKHQFFSAQLSLYSHIHTWLLQ